MLIRFIELPNIRFVMPVSVPEGQILGLGIDSKGKNANRVRTTFVHTATLLNLRGSEMWLIDVSNLLKDASFSVQVIDFDYAKRYPRTKEETLRRNRIIEDAFENISLRRLTALRLRTPLHAKPFIGKTLNAFVETYLHFLPGREFVGLLRETDVVYFVESQSRPIYLMVVLAASILAGRKPVIAGIHVQPKFTTLDLAFLKMFVRIGALKAIHLINRDHEKELNKLGVRVEYIPNGIYYEKFCPSDDGNEKRLQGEFSILFVGAMTEIKGADLLPEIYDALKKRNIQFNLVICTSGGELIDKIKMWCNGKPDVLFKGFVDREELLYSTGRRASFSSPAEGKRFPFLALRLRLAELLSSFRTSLASDR